MPPPEAAFDGLAADYDTDFTGTAIGRYLRGRAHQRLAQLYSAGNTALELGCGTGEDALQLMGRGVNVIATDASYKMLAIARHKLPNTVRVEYLDLHQLPDRAFPLLDGAFANFGVINVLNEHTSLARWLAQHIQPGGVLGFGVMAPYCLWELAWHAINGDISTATRRWRSPAIFAGNNSNPIPIYYPPPHHLAAHLAPYFERTHLEPLGLWLPPSDVFGVVEKRPRLLGTLRGLEQTSKRLSFLAPFADHYWIEFRRTDATPA